MRIKTIRYCYENRRDPFMHQTKKEKDERGMVQFTVVGDSNKYYMEVDVQSRHHILDIKNWDYSELEELYIDYELSGDDTPVIIDVNSIIKLPITRLHLQNVVINGQPRGARIVGDKGSDKYVWDNVLMYLPTLRSLTLMSDGVLYSLDFTYNPQLTYARFIGMDIRGIQGYEDQHVQLKFVACTMSEETALAIAKYSVHSMMNEGGFDVSFASEW